MKRKICCINIEIHHYSISPNSDNTSLFKRIINRKGQEDQSLQRLLAIFPLFLFSDPDRAVFAYIISHAYHQKKREKEKRWLPSLPFPI
jgi:hypothetical protein